MWSTSNHIHGMWSCDFLCTVSLCRYTDLVPCSHPSLSINFCMWKGEAGDQISYTHFSIISFPSRTSLLTLMCICTSDEKRYLSLFVVRYAKKTSCHWETRSCRLKTGLECIKETPITQTKYIITPPPHIPPHIVTLPPIHPPTHITNPPPHITIHIVTPHPTYLSTHIITPFLYIPTCTQDGVFVSLVDPFNMYNIYGIVEKTLVHYETRRTYVWVL